MAEPAANRLPRDMPLLLSLRVVRNHLADRVAAATSEGNAELAMHLLGASAIDFLSEEISRIENPK